MNSKEKHAELIKRTFKPLVKKWQYSGSGQIWWKKRTDHFSVLNLQNFSYNSADHVQFCFNIGIALPDRIRDPEQKKIVWADFFSPQREVLFLSEARRSLKNKSKSGYIIAQDTSLEDISNEIIGDFEMEIFPKLEKWKNIQEWFPFYNSLFRGEKITEFLRENYPAK